jgi:ribosomal protein S18 acetylase RimI-like enzyme
MGADVAGTLVDELVNFYITIYGGTDDPFFGRDRYRQQLTSHLGVRGWQLVTCRRSRELVGYTYGFPLPAGTSWWNGLLSSVPPAFTDENGRRTFAVSEVMVAAPYRRRGLARTLVDHLLSARPEPRATLLVEPTNHAAQAAYRSWGWRKAAEMEPDWPNAPRYDVLVLDLGSTRSATGTAT